MASRRAILRLGGGLLGLVLLPDLASAKQAPKPAFKVAARFGGPQRATRPRREATTVAKASASKPPGGYDRRVESRRPASGRTTASKTSAPQVARAERAPAPRIESIEPRIVGDRAPAILSPRGTSRGARTVALYNTHTGESIDVDYFVDGRYEPDALREVDRVLRDYHTDEICPIDPEVLNQLHVLRATLDTTETFNVYSGYRSPETNEMYRRLSSRVAEHSYHVKGKAIDLNLPGRELRQVRAVALALASGGVGYYPSSGFVHVDSGPVRRW